MIPPLVLIHNDILDLHKVAPNCSIEKIKMLLRSIGYDLIIAESIDGWPSIKLLQIINANPIEDDSGDTQEIII